MANVWTRNRPEWWAWLTVLSLDAPLVALTWQLFFVRLLRVQLRWDQSVLLGMGVWLVYMADRWIEGWRIPPHRVFTHRHFFPIRWRWAVFGAGLGLSGVTIYIAIACLESVEWIASLFLILPTAVYLFSHQLLHRDCAWRIPKEFCVAALFPLGPALAPSVQVLFRESVLCGGLNDIRITSLSDIKLPVFLFALLCLSNLSLISLWEDAVDAQHGQTSIAHQLGNHRGLIRLLPWCITISCLALWFTHSGEHRVSLACSGVSAFLLVALDWVEPRIGREAARSLVDLALLTPIVPLLLP